MEMPVNEHTPLVTSKTHDTSLTERLDVSIDVQQTGDSNKGNKKSDAVSTNGSKPQEKSGFKIFSSLSGRRKYTLILITIAQFLASVAFSMLGPFFPTQATKKGMGLSTIGFVFALFDAIVFLTSPFFGNYLVKIGPRFVFIAGIFTGGCCNILFGNLLYCPSGTPFIVMSILIRAVEGLGFSAFLTSSFAIVSSEFKGNIGFTFGILETGSGLGYLLGPSLGGALYELGGFGAPFYFAGVGVLLNGIAVYKFLPLVEELPAGRKTSMLTLLRSPAVIVPLGSVLVGMIGITTWNSTFAKRLEPLNFSVGMVGLLFGVVAGVYSVMASVWGYISDKLNIQSPLIIGGHLVFGVGYLLMGPSILLPFVPFNLTTILIGLACIGVSFGCALVPTMKCVVIGAIEMGFENDLDTYALVSGLFHSVLTFGGFVGPIASGYLVQEFDFPIAFTVVGMLSIFMMIVSFTFFTYRRFWKKRTEKTVHDNIEESHDDLNTHAREDAVTSSNMDGGPRSHSLTASFG